MVTARHVTHMTTADLRAGRLNADRAGALADMLDDAIDSPAKAATVLGLRWSKEELAEITPAYDEIICEAAASLPAAMSETAKAQRINNAFVDYRKGGWRRDWDKAECPARLRGLEVFAWRAFRLCDQHIGISTRSVRKKLAADNGRRPTLVRT